MTLTLAQHAALIGVLNGVNVESDIQPCFSAVRDQLGDYGSHTFYPATELNPFYFVVTTSRYTIVFANGVSARRHAEIIAQGYLAEGLAPGYPGVNTAYGIYAGRLLDALIAKTYFQDRLIIFAGHSFGAAACTVASRRLREVNDVLMVESVVWGCPKWAISRTIANTVGGLRQSCYAFPEDPVPATPPTTWQTPVLYGLLGYYLARQVKRAWQPCTVYGLNRAGEAVALDLNPWARLTTPIGLIALCEFADEVVDAVHGTGPYATAMVNYAVRYTPPDAPLRLHNATTTPPEPMTVRELATLTNQTVAGVSVVAPPLNPPTGSVSTPRYLIKRRKRTWWVRRGRVYLGRTLDKAAAIKVRKGGNQIIHTSGVFTAADLATVDRTVVTQFRPFFSLVTL